MKKTEITRVGETVHGKLQFQSDFEKGRVRSGCRAVEPWTCRRSGARVQTTTVRGTNPRQSSEPDFLCDP